MSLYDPQLLDRYATHLPLLSLAIGATTGPVLEIGCGMYSTFMLHGVCLHRRLVSLETDDEWFRRFEGLRSANHELHCGKSYEEFNTLIRGTKWDVVLVDHAPAERRIVDAVKVTDAKVVVFHDTNWEEMYRFSKVFPLYKHLRTDKRLYPWTTVASNSNDPALSVLFPRV